MCCADYQSREEVKVLKVGGVQRVCGRECGMRDNSRGDMLSAYIQIQTLGRHNTQDCLSVLAPVMPVLDHEMHRRRACLAPAMRPANHHPWVPSRMMCS
jgi:hypothetical protein